MVSILLAASAAVLLVTMIGLVALGVIASRKFHDGEERNLSRYRRRMLFRMLESRQPQTH
jgi:hypothetical protein